MAGDTTINMVVEDVKNYKPKENLSAEDTGKPKAERRTPYFLRQMIDYCRIGGFYR